MPLSPNAVTLAFRRIIKKAKLNHVRVHDLRHTHATLMLKAGVHPKIVSERLGHASIAITLDTYSHVLPGLQEEAVEKFDRIFNDDKENSEPNVSNMLAKAEDLASRPCRSRTCDHLIKSQGVLSLPVNPNHVVLYTSRQPCSESLVSSLYVQLSQEWYDMGRIICSAGGQRGWVTE